MDYDVIDLFLMAGLSDKKTAADFLKVNISTVTRWRSGVVELPHAVKLLLLSMAGYAPTLSRNAPFYGWRFSGDSLFTPENVEFTAGDIRAIKPMVSELRSYRVKVKELNSEIERLQNIALPKLPDNVVPFPNLKQG